MPDSIASLETVNSLLLSAFFSLDLSSEASLTISSILLGFFSSFLPVAFFSISILEFSRFISSIISLGTLVISSSEEAAFFFLDLGFLSSSSGGWVSSGTSIFSLFILLRSIRSSIAGATFSYVTFAGLAAPATNWNIVRPVIRSKSTINSTTLIITAGALPRVSKSQPNTAPMKPPLNSKLADL